MAAQVGGHRNLPQYNEEALKSALYHHVGTSVACMYRPTLPPLHLLPIFLIQRFFGDILFPVLHLCVESSSQMCPPCLLCRVQWLW